MQRFGDPARTIRIPVGQTFALELAGNPSTGYTWQASAESEHLQLLSQEFEPGGQGVGAGGHEVLRFCALAEGETVINCHYRRPWDKEARDTVRFRVTIE
jgi:inhibitor of cysteine peptidase